MTQHFNLETAISNWRHQFKYDRAFSQSDLDELERHLRDEIADLIDSGESPKLAFEQALSSMGGVLRAEREYDKVFWQKVRHEGRMRDEVVARWSMFTNYIKLGLRNLRRDTVPSTINIIGMSIALAVCIVVYLFVTAWNSMDSFHERGDRLFFAQHVVESAEYGPETWGRMPLPLGPEMEADIPQIERSARLNWHGAAITADGQVFDELVAFVDDNFLDMLTFPMASGSKSALTDPSSVILSHKMAEKFFGDEDPVGRSLTLVFDRRQRKEVTVGAVAAQFPSNTGLRFSLLMGFDRQAELGLVYPDDWSAETSGILVEVTSPSDIPAIVEQMDRYLPRINAAYPDQQTEAFVFENLADPPSDAYMVRGRINEAAHPAVTIMFVAMALFMMALSCFNYINIAVGTSSRRLNEIGMRKAMGGNRRQLVQQFLTENVLMCFVALVIAVVIAKVFLIPLLNSIFILRIELALTENLTLWGFLIALLLCVAFVSGAYPALYVSSFDTISIFRGRSKLGGNALLTRVFLTFQFVLAFLTVILGVLLMMNSRYLIKQDWGYDPADTIVIELPEKGQFEPLRDGLMRHPDVLDVAGSANHVGRGLDMVDLDFPDGGSQLVASYLVGPGYMEALGLRLSTGRFFDEAHPGDLDDALVVNQKFVTAQGWSDPVGRSVRVDDKDYAVIGVVEDFTFFFLADPVPTILRGASPESFGYVVIGTRAGAAENVEPFVETIWADLHPNDILRQFRQEQVFERTFVQYNNITQAFGYIAALALLIACMGLFGLASQSIARRKKEFGIRKVVGASMGQLAVLANRGFMIMLGIAATIATAVCVIGLTVVLSLLRDIVPIAHMPITPIPFSIAYAFVFGAAALAVGIHLFKIRAANPADVLRVD